MASLLLLMVVMVMVQGYDDRGPQYADVYMREMLATRECAVTVSGQFESWLVHVSDLHHYRYLFTVATEKFITQLNAGSDICVSMRPVLQRVMNAHRNVVNQRAALAMPVVGGDGWGETSAFLKERLSDADSLCRIQLPPEVHRVTILSCMRRVQKNAKKKLMAYHLP